MRKQKFSKRKRNRTMKKQNDYFKTIEKGTLEDAVQQIWNEDRVEIDERIRIDKRTKSVTLNVKKSESGELQKYLNSVRTKENFDWHVTKNGNIIISPKDTAARATFPKFMTVFMNYSKKIGKFGSVKIVTTNEDTVTESTEREGTKLDEKQNLELTTLDFDKMSDFKKASNYLKKQGIQYKNPYPFVLTIHNIDKLSKIKTKRDVENFLKKGRFKFDIRYAESTEHKGTKLDEKQNLELTTLDFDKMSDFKKARNYLEKQGVAPPGYGGGGGAQYDFDRDMYGDSLTIHNIDMLSSKIKTKRDVENFLKKGRFKLDIRYIGAESTERKGTKLDEVVTNYKLLAKDIKKEFQQQLRKKKFLTLNDIESYVMSNADSPHKVETDEIVKELKKLRITVAGKFPHKREEVEIDEIFGISSNSNHRAKTIKMLDGMGVKYKKDGRNGLIILGVAPKDQKGILDKIHKDIGMTTYRIMDEEVELDEAITSPSKYIDILNKLREETEYQKFFKSAMKKFGIKSPGELSGDKEKKFYDYVDKNWKGKNEPKEVGEKRNEKTLTGKPKDKIDVNPQTSDKRE